MRNAKQSDQAPDNRLTVVKPRKKKRKEPGIFSAIFKSLFRMFLILLFLTFLFVVWQDPSLIPFLRKPENDSPAEKASASTPPRREVSLFGQTLSKNDQALKNDMLQGVFYDIKQTRDRKPTPDFRNDSQEVYDTNRINKFLKVMTPFAKGNWAKKYTRAGDVHYPELDRFYVSSTRLWNTFFLIDAKIDAKDAPEAFQCGGEVSQSAWVCIYSGVVRAPFTGKFRFLGFCDDALLVRFNGRIVLDHGWHQFVSKDYVVGTYDTRIPDSTGLGKGLPIDVQKGKLYPVEIMFSEIPGGHFTLGLYFELLNSNGQPLKPNAKQYPLFRTTSDLPDQPRRLFPDYDPNGPIWKVVDSVGRLYRQK